jgi:hypothetical protein
MASKRTFYRTVLQVVVLSETPYNETSLSQIAEDITEGSQVGRVTITSENEEMNAKTAVVLLKEAGSEAEFFQLTNNGDDLIEDEDDDEEEDYKVRKMKD